jgi:hypothetical protein
MKQRGSSSIRFEDLQAEHRSLDRRLRALLRKGRPTPEDVLEIANLKKRKLATKDRMDALLRIAS